MKDSDRLKVDADYQSSQLLNQYNLDTLDTVELIELILNLKDPVIQKSVWNADRKAYVEVIDKKATLMARQYKNEIQNRFHDFVMDDRELALEVEQVYNECFNNYVLQQYDLPTFDVYPGASSVIDGQAVHSARTSEAGGHAVHSGEQLAGARGRSRENSRDDYRRDGTDPPQTCDEDDDCRSERHASAVCGIRPEALPDRQHPGRDEK